MRFTGKIALVTGAASGIGLATAGAFAEAGAGVVLTDINKEDGESAASQLRSAGHAARFVYADMTDPASILQLFDDIAGEEGRLDFAFNNAGIEGVMAPVDQSDPANWDRVLAINLTSVYQCMRHEIPMIRDAGGGAIINNSSIAGLVGTAGGAAYCASKHGMIGLTRAAALDHVREGVRVNAVCPGGIDTAMVQRVYRDKPETKQMIEEMQPIGRLGKPEEVAAAVLWLCQPESAFVTGIALPIDGAWTAR